MTTYSVIPFYSWASFSNLLPRTALNDMRDPLKQVAATFISKMHFLISIVECIYGTEMKLEYVCIKS